MDFTGLTADGGTSSDAGSSTGEVSGPERWQRLDWVRATDDPDPAAECIEIATEEGGLVHLRQSDDPDTVVTTTQAKWDAFVLGVRNNEFDHFVEEADEDSAAAHTPDATSDPADAAPGDSGATGVH